MRDDERADGGQFRERVRPGLGGEVPGETLEHVVTRVVTERHEERGKEDRALAALPEKGAQTVGRSHKDVTAATLDQRALELGKRDLAFRTAMAGEGNAAAGERGHGLIKRCGNGGVVRFAREQGRDKTEFVKAGGGGVHGGRSFLLETSVDNVRRCHEDAAGTAAPQTGKHV